MAAAQGAAENYVVSQELNVWLVSLPLLLAHGTPEHDHQVLGRHDLQSFVQRLQRRVCGWLRSCKPALRTDVSC